MASFGMPTADKEQAALTRNGRIALAALLATSVLLGLTTTLSKVAGQAGIAPTAYLAWSALGAGLLLLGWAGFRGHRLRPDRRSVEYWTIAALLSVAGPNLIFFSTVQQVGVGFVAMMIALPPLLTYAGALALRMEHFAAWRALGVLLALLGAAAIAMPKLTDQGAPTGAVLLTLVGPVLLAAGNLYRTARWPAGASPEALAPGMMIAAALLVFAASAAINARLALPSDAFALGLTLLQALVFAAQYLTFFVLQKHGGPVFLSLLGAVAALFAVPAGMMFLGETPPKGLAPAAVLIGAGVLLLTLKAQKPAKTTNSGSPNNVK